MNLNKVMLIGNLTRDPESRNIASGSNVTNFGIATNLVWTDDQGQKQQKVEFHNIVVWRKLAEICDKYLKKGSKIYVEGRLQTSSWDAEDGTKRYKTEIVMENMIMLDNKGDNSNNNSYQQSNQTQNNIPTQNNNNETKEDEIRVENIPF